VELDYGEFGQALRRLREDSSISLREMAKRLGYSASFLSNCELGHRKLKLRAQVRFVRYCMEAKNGTDE